MAQGSGTRWPQVGSDHANSAAIDGPCRSARRPNAVRDAQEILENSNSPHAAVLSRTRVALPHTARSRRGGTLINRRRVLPLPPTALVIVLSGPGWSGTSGTRAGGGVVCVCVCGRGRRGGIRNIADSGLQQGCSGREIQLYVEERSN